MGEDYKPLGGPIPLRLEKTTEILVDAVAAQTGEKKAAIMRRYIDAGVKAELLLDFGIMDEVLSILRKAISETNKPYEERMAKIRAKDAIASLTALFLTQEVIGQLGKKDVRILSEEARKRAIAALRAKEPVSDQAGELDE